jgi:hypothetical protein
MQGVSPWLTHIMYCAGRSVLAKDCYHSVHLVNGSLYKQKFSQEMLTFWRNLE